MYVRNDACIIDGRLAEVHAGADIQGEEGSEEDAARAEHAGQGDICSDSYYCTLILYMHELTEQVRCRHQRKGTKDVCGRFAQTHIYIHTYIHTYIHPTPQESPGRAPAGEWCCWRARPMQASPHCHLLIWRCTRKPSKFTSPTKIGPKWPTI